MASPPRFDIKTAPQFSDYEEMLRVWREADEIPIIEGAWLFDHFMPLGPDQTGPIFEGWTLLSAYAAQTKRIRVGIMVTGNTYRHPAVLANMGATVDVISGGRLDFGIGAGWFEFEHNAFGIPLYSPGERIRRLGEACEVILRMWTERAASFDGKYYHLQNAYCEPKPVQKPHPPIVIGGGGEQLTLRVVARYADIWNMAGGDVETFLHKNDVLNRHCQEIGRDPAEIVRSIQVGFQYDDPEGTREQARQFIEAGASHIVLNLRPPYPDGVAERAAREIIEPLGGGKM
jgi:F420-dependent oxidoreductase-like protein